MIFKTKLLIFFNLLQFIIFVKSVDYDVNIQFKINHLDTVNYKNIRIVCQSDNIHLDISFVPNSVATNIYEGKLCFQNKYKLVIADQNNNENNLEFICPEFQTDDYASLIPANIEIVGVILYTVNINGNTCNKSVNYVERNLFLTDVLFHSHSAKSNKALSNLITRKITFLEEYYKERKTNLGEWQQLLQIETIEFLLGSLVHTRNYQYQKTRFDSIKKNLMN
uniref:Uncharacterized protein n=1 Tax=Meloidogyne enterolobii TaxID=390850 RepID=A0A6V7YF76_MELEN|nr:unnamed protein product [Meloidogyne enterolobii]